METYLVKIKKKKGSKKDFDGGRYPDFRYVKTGKYAFHWEKKGVEKEELARLVKQARRDSLVLSSVPERFCRSTNYRDSFLSEVEFPTRCIYCNRKLAAASDLSVDHVVSVAKAKKSYLSRYALKVIAASSVNDKQNLAPSCMACNRKKADKGGLWILRGILGRYRAYWIGLYLVCGLSLTAAIGTIATVLPTILKNI